MRCRNTCVLLLCFLRCFFVFGQKNDSITVYIFLSETCPICQSQTLELRNLYKDYAAKGIEFIGLFPNITLSNEATIHKFSRKYNIDFELRLDNAQKMKNQLSATHTPQVFVLRNVTGKVLYSGRIDNGFEGIGRRRQVTTEHYLKSALENIVQKIPVNPERTQAVGCFIVD